ncbi:MAG: protein translocase subunit SecF [Candidatus Cloacimonetes bacterium 4572_55]|nr:MAG: protein translocase subunit SecF [Candidatus Cloacimonetes bacterium 4572_55]
MQIFTDANFDFLNKRRIAYIGSSVVVLLGIIGLIFGLNYGIDFTGGTLVQIKFFQDVKIEKIREVLGEVDLEQAEIQLVGDGSEFLIRAPEVQGKDTGDIIKGQMDDAFGKEAYELRREEKVGPKIGSELRWTAIQAILFSLLFMIAYIWFRFDLRFGVAAVIALFHDVFVVLGLFWVTRLEITLPVIAAILTVVGYSINDSIVVFDRIRENLRLIRRAPLPEIINTSINQTLSRTVITSLTTFVVVFMVLIFGGDVLFGFAFALTIGVVTGTYSSIFVASPIVVEWANYQERKTHERLQAQRPSGKRQRRKKKIPASVS